MTKKPPRAIQFSRISPYNEDGSVKIWSKRYKKTDKLVERLKGRIRAFKPFTWVLIAFYSICMLAAFVSSVRATHDSLQAETRDKTQVILKLQRTAQELQSVKGQSATSESQVKAQTDQINQLKAKIDELNKQLQAKLAAPSPVAVAPSGFGGAYAGPITFENSYAFGNCTWYVAGVIHVPSNLGNANTWASIAASEGYVVSSAPKINSVAQTTAGVYGHVAVVIAIGNGQVEVSEMNAAGFDVVDTRWTPVSDWVYIYF